MDELDAINRESGREHLAALDVFRHAKTALFWLALVAVALHLIMWAIARNADSATAGMQWNLSMEWALAIAGFVGRASVFGVTMVFVMTLLLSLTTRLGGAAPLAKACVYSMIALALLVPWVRISPQDFGGISSAFFGVDELQARGEGVGGADSFFAFIRFVVCPLLVVAFLGTAQNHFRMAFRKMTDLPAAKLPIREV